MVDRTLLRKKALIQKLQALNPSQLKVDAFFREAFSIIQEEIHFQVAWYSAVEPSSLQRKPCDLQIWRASPPQIGSDRTLFDGDMFPTVQELLKKISVRGEACWTTSQFTNNQIYQEILKPKDLFFSFITLLLDDHKQCIGYLVMWKIKSDGPFDDADFLLLSDLAPILGVLLQAISNDPKVSEEEGSANGPPARLFNPIQKISGIDEEELYSLIRRRAQPGILLLSQNGKILYSNRDARHFIERLVTKPSSRESAEMPSANHKDELRETGRNQQNHREDSKHSLPEIIYEIYDHFTKTVIQQEKTTGEAIPTINRICIQGGVVYLLRALPLNQHEGEQDLSDIMILIERVSQGVRVDQIEETTKLTPRESDVVHLLLEGKTNKEIAVCIDIGEYTVKDHIKRIMKKLEVTTRAGIVAKVLQSHFPS